MINNIVEGTKFKFIGGPLPPSPSIVPSLLTAQLHYLGDKDLSSYNWRGQVQNLEVPLNKIFPSRQTHCLEGKVPKQYKRNKRSLTSLISTHYETAGKEIKFRKIVNFVLVSTR